MTTFSIDVILLLSNIGGEQIMKSDRIIIRVKRETFDYYQDMSAHNGISLSAMCSLALTSYMDNNPFNERIYDRERATQPGFSRTNVIRGKQRSTQKNRNVRIESGTLIEENV